jgi:hypothetical protein
MTTGEGTKPRPAWIANLLLVLGSLCLALALAEGALAHVPWRAGALRSGRPAWNGDQPDAQDTPASTPSRTCSRSHVAGYRGHAIGAQSRLQPSAAARPASRGGFTRPRHRERGFAQNWRPVSAGSPGQTPASRREICARFSAQVFLSVW